MHGVNDDTGAVSSAVLEEAIPMIHKLLARRVPLPHVFGASAASSFPEFTKDHNPATTPLKIQLLFHLSWGKSVFGAKFPLPEWGDREDRFYGLQILLRWCAEMVLIFPV